MDLDIRLVRSFVAVATTLSFTKASSMVKVTQPQLSIRIRNLENHLGLRLFERTSRKVSLTVQGERLLLNAKRLLDEHDMMEREINDIKFGISRALRVGSVEYFQPVRRRFLSLHMKRYPDDVVEVESTRHAEALSLLLTGQLDASFLSMPDNEALPDEFEAMLLASAPVGLLLPTSSPLCAKRELIAADLKGLNVALFRRELSPALHDAALTLVSGMEARLVRLPEPSEAGLVDFVRTTGQAAACAQWWTAAEDKPEGIVHRTIADLSIHFQSLLVRPRHRSSPACDRLWRLVKWEVAQRARSEPISDLADRVAMA